MLEELQIWHHRQIIQLTGCTLCQFITRLTSERWSSSCCPWTSSRHKTQRQTRLFMWSYNWCEGDSLSVLSQECRTTSTTQRAEWCIWWALIKAKIPATKEPIGLTHIGGLRSDGVTLVPWSKGRCLTWDVTVPDTLAVSHLDRTSISSGAAAEQAAVNKTTKYSNMLHDYHFVPVAVETLWPWCDAALNFITHQLGRQMTVVTGEQ